jgi:hypothetical protein
MWEATLQQSLKITTQVQTAGEEAKQPMAQ